MISTMDYNETVVCVFDKDFDMGFGALCNSLVKSGFKGLINAGYRGALPSWISQVKKIDEENYFLNDDIVIHLTMVDTDMHLGYYKPYFIKQTFDNYPSTKKLFYFDVDIVVKAPWHIFSNWLEEGACVCLDSAFHYVHHNHPWRKDWRRALNLDEALHNNTNQYFNSGFLGVERSSIVLIDRWILFTEKYIEMGGNKYAFVKEVSSSFKGDQDLLNAAITNSADIEFSVMGTEAMGFTLPATVMLHAIGVRKPWNKRYISHLIKIGQPPNMAEKAFFSFSQYPISLFSTATYKMKRLEIRLASMMGRFLS